MSNEPRPRHNRILGTVLSLTLVAATLVIGSAPASADESGVMFGAYAQPRRGENLQQAVEALEARLGTTLPIVRSYGRFDAPVDGSFNRWAAHGGRVVLAGISTKLNNGDRLRWSEIAEARPGSSVHRMMLDLARSAARLEGELWIAFSHEPEASFNRDLGTHTEFIAAWRKLRSIFVAEGAGAAQWVWTMTSWSFEVDRIDPNDRRRAELWYPGDDHVDMLGADPYNWNRCRGGNERWTSLEDTLRPFLEWSRGHPTKPLVLPEFGSVEGAAGLKAQWLHDAADLLRDPEWGDRFAAVLYFHDDHSDTQTGTECRWWLDSSASALDAARAIAADPYFSERGGTRGPVECDGMQATIVGTLGDDILWGTSGDDVIAGLSGRDRIDGLGGNDVICGGDGNDVITGGSGDDRILGQNGRDVLRGGAADDVLIGGRHRDRLSGGAGDDRILGGSGGDVLYGSAGADTVFGGNGNDRASGNAGRDTVSGGNGSDVCEDKSDADRISVDCERIT